jgi:hypothetical protein
MEKLCDEIGLAIVRVMAFEDQDALWDVPYEDIGRYQFRKDGLSAPPENVAFRQQAAERFNRHIEIPLNEVRQRESFEAISVERQRVAEWLSAHSRFLQSGKPLPMGEADGAPLLWADTNAYLDERGLSDVEEVLTRNYVSYPANETVKAHRVAVAQLGLAPYKGKMLRDRSQTIGPLSLDQRAAHVIVRMGFVQALFQACGVDSVVLYRAESAETGLRARDVGGAIISASFRMDIVQEMAGWVDSRRTVALYRQAVPIERVLMTYLETGAMNRTFREAEAVLLAAPTNLAF